MASAAQESNMKKRFNSQDYYPPYYIPVCIEYIHRGRDKDHILFARAWLSVDPDDNYIWTLEDTEEIIADSKVINWTNY